MLYVLNYALWDCAFKGQPHNSFPAVQPNIRPAVQEFLLTSKTFPSED